MSSFAMRNGFFLIFLTHLPSTVLSENENPPKIWLERYRKTGSFEDVRPDVRYSTQTQYGDGVINKTDNDFVVLEPLFYAIFTCEAGYPIHWKFPTSMYIMNQFRVLNSRASNFSVDDSEPKNRIFTSSLKVYFGFDDNFISANVTCAPIDPTASAMSPSIYIFFQNKPRIENRGKTLSILADSSTPFVLPCRPASPNIKLMLEKESTTKDKTWEAISTAGSNVTFNPKFGFTLHSGPTIGLYRCSILDVSGNSSSNSKAIRAKEFVIFNVTKTGSENNLQVKPNYAPRSILQGKSSFSMKKTVTKTRTLYDITCCTGVKENAPYLTSYPCTDLENCQANIRNHYVRFANTKTNDDWKTKKGNCSTHQIWDNIGGVLVCQGENVDYLKTFVGLFQSPNWSEENQKKSFNDTSYFSKFVPLTPAKDVAIPEKLAMLVTKPLNISKHYPNNLYFSDTHPNFTFGFDNQTSQHMQEYNRDVYYEGESLRFVCLGIRFFYTPAPQLRLNWQNGTKMVIEEPVLNVTLVHGLHLVHNTSTVFNERAEEAIVAEFSSVLVADRKMSSVDCWMPRVQSSEWDKISKLLQILPSVAPKFAEKENETLNFNSDDTGHLITCTVSQGLPVPHLTVWQGEKSYDLNLEKPSSTTAEGNVTLETTAMNKAKNTFAVNIRFPKVIQEHQSVYKCIATNVNGTVTRTVNVMVGTKKM